MLTLSWRRVGSSVGLTLALVVGLPSLAQAQLFPNLYIQRQRTECANEPPFYKHVRRDFFGYYPTCWRRFPEGWACPCPNPERPNREESYRLNPADDKTKLMPPDDVDSEMGPDDRDTGAPKPGGTGRRPGPNADPDLPGVPRGTRSPFEVDPKPPSLPNGLDNADPFDTPKAPAGVRPVPPGGGLAPLNPPNAMKPDAPAASPIAAPSLNAPATIRPAGVSSRSSTSMESSTPVLALPEMSPPSGSLPAESTVLSSLPASLPTSGAFIETPEAAPVTTSTPTAPARAPRRTSVIGSLFGMGNRTQK
jgi:hypothetical protein